MLVCERGISTTSGIVAVVSLVVGQFESPSPSPSERFNPGPARVRDFGPVHRTHYNSVLLPPEFEAQK